MSDQFPPDDDLGPEMTPLQAFSRAMRIKLRLNREAQARRAAASQASEKSAQPSEPSDTPVGPVSAEEPDQAILDRFPGLTKEDLELINQIT